jgi:hypothetical protein
VTAAQEKSAQYKDEEVRQAYQTYNMRHAEMNVTEASYEFRRHEPNVHIENEAHRERAKHMLGLMGAEMERKDPPRIPRTQRTSEPPTFTKPLMNVNAKEGQAVKMEVNFKVRAWQRLKVGSRRERMSVCCVIERMRVNESVLMIIH